MKKKSIFCIKLISYAVLALSIERFCHHQTRGFRPYKVISNFAYDERFSHDARAEDHLDAINQILSHRFTFLGDGGQGYSFLSDDNKHVLKLYKLHHTRYPHWIKDLALPPMLNTWKQKYIALQDWKKERVFTSSKIAFDMLKKETGLVYLHLNRTIDRHPSVTIVDSIGCAHTLALDNVVFAIQLKAQPAFKNFKKLAIAKKETDIQAAIDTYLPFIAKRFMKGVGDYDDGFRRNFGEVDNELIEIDIGCFYTHSHTIDQETLANELRVKSDSLFQYLSKYFPEMIPYLEKSIEHTVKDAMTCKEGLS
jgi:hypothetical protein